MTGSSTNSMPIIVGVTLGGAWGRPEGGVTLGGACGWGGGISCQAREGKGGVARGLLLGRVCGVCGGQGVEQGTSEFGLVNHNKAFTPRSMRHNE